MSRHEAILVITGRAHCFIMITYIHKGIYITYITAYSIHHRYITHKTYHCKKGIPYSRALRLSRICSNNENFDKRYNDLEKCLMERGYNEKMIRKQILRAREHSRNDLFERKKPQMPEQKLTFNITYCPAFQNIRAIMDELHIRCVARFGTICAI